MNKHDDYWHGYNPAPLDVVRIHSLSIAFSPPQLMDFVCVVILQYWQKPNISQGTPPQNSSPESSNAYSKMDVKGDCQKKTPSLRVQAAPRTGRMFL